MGVYYKAKIVVGLPRAELIKLASDSGHDVKGDPAFEDDYFENNGLTEFSSYYDGAGEGTNIVGLNVITTEDYGACEIQFAMLPEAITEKLGLFKEQTGFDGRLFLTVYGY